MKKRAVFGFTIIALQDNLQRRIRPAIGRDHNVLFEWRHNPRTFTRAFAFAMCAGCQSAHRRVGGHNFVGDFFPAAHDF
jgi:hypothetical protein